MTSVHAAEPPPLYLALDQGGHSSRALALTATGDCVAQARVAIETQVLSDVRIEHSATELADSLKTCCTQIAKELGDDVLRLARAGLATQRSSIVCWQRSTGEPLSSVLSWQDRRAADLITAKQDESETVEALTGLVMSPHYGASKLHWCLRNLDRVAAAREANDLTVGPLASYLVRALTGSLPDVCDPANASRTLLWNRHTRNWSSRLCELFDIDPSLLPESVPTRHSFGDLQVGDHSVPLDLVTGDQSSAIYAFGQARSNVAFINLGTGAFMQCPTGDQAVDVDGLLNSVVYQDDSSIEYVLEGTVNGAGRALTWWAKRSAADSRDLVRTAIHRAATDSAFRNTVPVFLNGISGLGSPYWRSHFESEFVYAGSSSDINISDAPGPEAGALAILDSIVFLLHANIERAATRIDRFDRLVVTGGLASVDYLCQTLADISGIETVRSTLREATAKGVGFLLSLDQNWPGAEQLTAFRPAPNRHLSQRHTLWQQHMALRTQKTSV